MGLLSWLLGEPKQPPTQPTLHKGEEYGQSRALTAEEVLACLLMSALKGAVAAIGGGLLYTLTAKGIPFDWSILTWFVVTAICGLVTFCSQAWGDLDTMMDGLRSYRIVETFAPPQAQPPLGLPAPDITVYGPGKKNPYTIARGGGPGASAPRLPSPAQQRMVTPQVIGAAIQAALDNEGVWSRSTITAVRVGTSKITRGMWQKMTVTLQEILIPQADGSRRLHPDIATFEDVAKHIPALAALPRAAGPPKTLPPACPPARLPARPGKMSKKELFEEYGCEARVIVERKKKEERNG